MWILFAMLLFSSSSVKCFLFPPGTLYKSMLNLSSIDSTAPVSPTSPCAVLGAQCDGRSPSDPLCSRSLFPEISVQICINDVSVDNPEDFQTASGDEDEHNLELIRRQKRRSSWCPEKERKRDEKEEKQRMLGVNGRRWDVLFCSELKYNLWWCQACYVMPDYYVCLLISGVAKQSATWGEK